MSTTFDSCVPNPICKSGTYDFNDLKDVQSINKYLGDNSKINWQAQGNPVLYPSGGVALTMAEGTVGTLLASTFYVWYGKICATMSTSQGQGVVTAFIMMSDVKDEIDFEFIGNDAENAQSNWYSQGVTNCKPSTFFCLCDTRLMIRQTKTWRSSRLLPIPYPRSTNTASTGPRMLSLGPSTATRAVA
jgi:hypothetical protein